MKITKVEPLHLGTDIVDAVPQPENGFVTIAARPGIGIELLSDAAKIRPPLTEPIAMRPRFDGFVVDQ